jgi:hypothetical protein
VEQETALRSFHHRMSNADGAFRFHREVRPCYV